MAAGASIQHSAKASSVGAVASQALAVRQGRQPLTRQGRLELPTIVLHAAVHVTALGISSASGNFRISSSTFAMASATSARSVASLACFRDTGLSLGPAGG